MITKKYSITKNVSEPKIMVGFISVAFLFLALMCAIDPSTGQRMEVFAQEVNNTNASSLTITSEELEPIQVDFVSNIEQIRGHLNAAVMNKEALITFITPSDAKAGTITSRNMDFIIPISDARMFSFLDVEYFQFSHSSH